MTRKEKYGKDFDATCARWRVSKRSEGATTCVEAATDGTVVALANSNERHPCRPVLVVPVSEWLTFLDCVGHGHVDLAMMHTPKTAGPFLVRTTGEGLVEVRCSDEPDGPRLRYTPEEWKTFISGITLDGEFTIAWLLSS